MGDKMDEKDYILWLSNVEGVGVKTLEKLIRYYGSGKNIFNSSTNNLYSFKGIPQSTIENILKNKNVEYIEKLKCNFNKNSIEVLSKTEEDYPENLKNIYDPPYILYKKGYISEKDNNAIAIVGSRNPSPYGKWAAYKFASELARIGITIISGLAYGIDTVAHKGAIEGGGRTIAVLGCGIDICYPKSNFNLMRNIPNSGSIVSEYSMGIQPVAGHFPARNRIISGLAKGVIVIEAAERSGSLITAEFALDQGREVFAVPGNINSPLSKGTNKLIKEGAKLVNTIEDILEELDLIVENKKSEKNKVELSSKENEIYKFIKEKQPIPFDVIFSQFKLNINELSSIITILELKGLIEQLPGKIIILK